MATKTAAKSNTGRVVEDKPSVVDHAIVGAANGWDAMKAAATSDTAKELGKTTAQGFAMGIGLGVGLLVVDAIAG